jgi:integrase
VLGRGKKRGEIVHLDPEMREYVDRCRGEDGHLFELENAYQRGAIDDYHLFQKGKLRNGRIPLERHLDAPGPIELGSLIDLFRSFEAACGVEHVPNRSFYGLRRALTDAAPHYTSDSRELDRMSGHEDPTTREKIYQDRLREEYREGAAEARRAMRLDLVAGRPPPKRRRSPRQDLGGDAVRTALQRVLGVEVTAAQAQAIARELGGNGGQAGTLQEGEAGAA